MDSADPSGGKKTVSRPPPVGVPRRFGIGSLLGITTLFSVIFFIAQIYDVPRQTVAGTGVFFGLIGVAQWMTGEGPRARWVSAIAGGLSLPLLVFASFWMSQMGNSAAPTNPTASISIVGMIVFCCPLGALFGYAAGTLVAGVFLVMHWADDWIARRLHPEPDHTSDSIVSED